MHPVITDVAKAYTGRLRCLRLNTDENQDVATRYGIGSIPNNGERKETVLGAVTDTTRATTVERFFLVVVASHHLYPLYLVRRRS
ncbi:hypothetical protein BS78_10G267500 [Paspalum vaginatum]|nr:hypothetical protein BS78_10G267500 [Paspalum vaginatum]